MKILAAVIFLCVSSLNAQTTSIKSLPIELPNRPATLSHLSLSPARLTTTHHNVFRASHCWQRFSKDIQLKEWVSGHSCSQVQQLEQAVKELGGDPESPAFSELIARVTVLKDELFETADSRQAMLARRFGLPPGSILDYAVTHQMGHAICGERQENLADKYGLDLRRGIAPSVQLIKSGLILRRMTLLVLVGIAL